MKITTVSARSLFNIGRGVYSRAMQLANRNYYLARARYERRLGHRQERYKGSPLIILQMGKVGSSTIHRSLSALGLDRPIYHIHFLTKELLAEHEQKRRKYFRTAEYSRLKFLWLQRFLRKQIDEGADGRKWDIVTLTREPIARNISAFFERLEVKLSDGNDQYKIKSKQVQCDIDITVRLDDIRELTDFFFAWGEHDFPLAYFDRELKDIFGIDVFASEFPKSKGYQIYENKRARVLLMRLENLKSCVSDAFRGFLGIDNLTLINTNIAAEKDYALLYQQFRDNVVLPETYIDKLYNSKYARHFYSKAEIEEFRDKWHRE